MFFLLFIRHLGQHSLNPLGFKTNVQYFILLTKNQFHHVMLKVRCVMRCTNMHFPPLFSSFAITISTRKFNPIHPWSLFYWAEFDTYYLEIAVLAK